jgi:hypothetical protein
MPRWNIARSALVAMLLLTTACAQTSGQAVHAPKPPADYVFLSSGDNSNEKNIAVGINTDLMMSDDPDSMTLVLFGMKFALAIQHAVPADSGAAGSGLKVGDPITFAAVAAETEFQAAANYLVQRFPKLTNAAGYLFRSPERRYLLWVTFDTATNGNALYFDVTKWAIAMRKN